MKPPLCVICEEFHKKCTIISFKKRPSDVAWQKKAEETHMTGHPPWIAWFCDDHVNLAREHAYLTIDVALAQIREKLGRT